MIDYLLLSSKYLSLGFNYFEGWCGEGNNGYAESWCWITYRIERITTSVGGYPFTLSTIYIFLALFDFLVSGALLGNLFFTFPSLLFYSAPPPTNTRKMKGLNIRYLVTCHGMESFNTWIWFVLSKSQNRTKRFLELLLTWLFTSSGSSQMHWDNIFTSLYSMCQWTWTWTLLLKRDNNRLNPFKSPLSQILLV